MHGGVRLDAEPHLESKPTSSDTTNGPVRLRSARRGFIFRDRIGLRKQFLDVTTVAALALSGASMAEDAPATFRERAEAVSGSVWRCLRRFGVPQADADDCFQSVLLQLHARWDRLALLNEGELRSYACCVAIGVARGAARSRQRTEQAQQPLVEEDVAAEGTPESHVERREELAQLDAILATLPEERREVFVLFELEGLTGPEIAQHLGLAEGTVASRLRRARADFEAAVARSLAVSRRKLSRP
ncbi:MAG: sigma-70 family RNA polymerase sigma factor [Labilithrix sp.]|nr:sigma-70 family RNA polymerase sigma factor [Labilithrix sp.]